MRAALNTLTVGKTENEVAAAIHEAEIRHGCEYTGIPHILGSGYRIQLGHVNWSDKRIEKGDIIHLELSGCVKRYSAALMRTAIMGQPTPGLMKAAEVMIDNQDRAISLMKPGVSAGEIDAIVRQPVLKAGLRETYHSRVGYSIGIGFPPRWGEWATRDFMHGDTWRLEAGMVFHMLVTAKGVGLSETVLVTQTGQEKLTHFDRKLFNV
jgi:Xaa-Pro dipeptidase